MKLVPVNKSEKAVEENTRHGGGINGLDESPIIPPKSFQDRINSFQNVVLYLVVASLVLILIQKIYTELSSPGSENFSSVNVSSENASDLPYESEIANSDQTATLEAKPKMNQGEYLELACSAYIAEDIEGMWRYFPRLLIGEYKDVAKAGMWIADSMAGRIMGHGSDHYSQIQLANSYTVILNSFCRK